MFDKAAWATMALLALLLCGSARAAGSPEADREWGSGMVERTGARARAVLEEPLCCGGGVAPDSTHTPAPLNHPLQAKSWSNLGTASSTGRPSRRAGTCRAGTTPRPPSSGLALFSTLTSASAKCECPPCFKCFLLICVLQWYSRLPGWAAAASFRQGCGCSHTATRRYRLHRPAPQLTPPLPASLPPCCVPAGKWTASSSCTVRRRRARCLSILQSWNA